MRYILLLFILAGSGFMLLRSASFAIISNPKNPSGQGLSCPVEIPTFSKEMCQDDRFFEAHGPEVMTKVLDYFNEELIKAYQDTSHEGKFMGERGAWQARQFRHCLDLVCQKIGDDCSKHNSQTTNIPSQRGWCESKKNKLKALQEEKVKFFANYNAAIKSSSAQSQRVDAISQKFNDQIEPQTNSLKMVLDESSHKISCLATNPAESGN